MEKIDKAKIEYLEEHIPYELLMLRRTYQQMNSCTDQLDWNAFLRASAFMDAICTTFSGMIVTIEASRQATLLMGIARRSLLQELCRKWLRSRTSAKKEQKTLREKLTFPGVPSFLSGSKDTGPISRPR